MIMNKKLLSTALLAVLLFFAGGQWADAASWRINNNANRHAHFTDINAAMSSNSGVSDGDTLYLDPGCLITSTQNVTKRVTIIGTGFLLDGSVLQEAAIIGGLNIKASGTKVEGVRLSKLSDKQAKTAIQANNVTLERCRYDHISVEGQYAIIRQCCGYRIYGCGASDPKSSNCTIENCVIATSGTISVFNLSMPIIRNNYSHCEYSGYTFEGISNGSITNNLLLRTNGSNLNKFFNNVDATIKNNVMSCTENALGSTYPNNVYLGSLPEGTYYQHPPIDTDKTDADLPILKDLNALHGAATDGGDCGPFGGLYPYVPSGYPFGMPHFESSVVGTRPQSGQVSVTQQVTIQKQ